MPCFTVYKLAIWSILQIKSDIKWCIHLFATFGSWGETISWVGVCKGGGGGGVIAQLGMMALCRGVTLQLGVSLRLCDLDYEQLLALF